MNTIKSASFGTVSHGTLKTEDLLSAFASELEWQIQRNGEFFSMPENFRLRDSLNALVGEAQDAWNDDGETLQDEEIAVELVNSLCDVLTEHFAPAYGYFGASEGDGSDFGFWLGSIDDIKEQVGFVSSKGEEQPPSDFTGEWLHVNERGNCTLYVRDAESDHVIWGIV